MYSDVFRMYPRARVGKPSDTIKIQHARCEYKRILTHEGSMTLRYKVPYTIQARYKQDTVEYRYDGINFLRPRTGTRGEAAGEGPGVTNYGGGAVDGRRFLPGDRTLVAAI